MGLCSKIRSRAVAAVGLAWAVAGVCQAQSTSPEVRAMWVTRFEWVQSPTESESTIKARIDGIMANLQAHHFNAVFYQIRGQCDVLYPSPYEVWSPLIHNGTNPGWDPLAYAISSAHAHGIQFHAYMNTHTCWQSSDHLEPANANHVFYQHARASDPAHRDWLIHDSAGSPVQWSENDYVWLAPGVPAYQAYVRQQILYVAEHYDVDGIHYDRIRTPNSSYSYDPISQARRASPQSNPDGLDFSHWTRDQITRMVRDMYAAIMAVKPGIVVSAAVFPSSSSAPSAQHQDALTWAQTGGLDMIVPMMYSSGAAGSTWDNYMIAWLAGCGGRQVVPGQAANVGSSMLLQQIALTRTRAAQGNAVYSWSNFTYWDDYLANVYQNEVAPPAMSWKTNPTTAIIYGYVKDANGTPVVDAQVTRSGSSYVGLSSGDGFYSLLLVPAGTQTVQASHSAYSAGSPVSVTVSAGQVVRRDITLGSVLPPIIAEVSPDPETASIASPYTRQLTLTQGTADSWTLLEGPSGAVVSSTGMVSGWTPSDAQQGHTVTFAVRAINAGGSDDESWQVRVGTCSIYKLNGFEDDAVTAKVQFLLPRYSGTTSANLASSPNVCEVTDEVAGFRGSHSLKVQWQFVDTAATRWMRLTTYQAASKPNPTVVLNRPIRFRMRLDSGSLRVCVGIRETATTAEVGADGGTGGTIEFVGATSVGSGSCPQGVLVTAQPGVWQQLEFNPLTDPVLAFSGDGVLSTLTGKGVFECIGFTVVDSAGPFTVYLDDIDFMCYREPFGDLNKDGYVDSADWFDFAACGSGPALPVAIGCTACDADSDGDVDAMDFATWQRCYSGVLPQLDPYCGD